MTPLPGSPQTECPEIGEKSYKCSTFIEKPKHRRLKAGDSRSELIHFSTNSLLFPAAPECLEQIGDRRTLQPQRIDAALLGGRQVALRVRHFELVRHPVVVAQAHKAQGVAERSGAIAFGLQLLARR